MVYSKSKNNLHLRYCYFKSVFSITNASSFEGLKGRIAINSTVYEVGSCGENEKNETYIRCKRAGYKGFLVFVRAQNRQDAIGELMEHCEKKGLRNVTRSGGPSSSGWVYAVGLRI